MEASVERMLHRFSSQWKREADGFRTHEEGSTFVLSKHRGRWMAAAVSSTHSAVAQSPAADRALLVAIRRLETQSKHSVRIPRQWTLWPYGGVTSGRRAL